MERRELLLRTKDPVLVIDQDLAIVLWNEGAEKLFGFKPTEVLGRRCFELMGCRDGPDRLVCGEDCLNLTQRRRQGSPPVHEFPVRTKGGEEIWISVSTMLMPSRKKELSVSVLLVRDLSYQKEVDHFVEQLLSIGLRLASSQKTCPQWSRRPSLDHLTVREREILRLLVSGSQTKAIAQKLFISPFTARNHIHKILAKLKVRNRVEAINLAIRNGLT